MPLLTPTRALVVLTSFLLFSFFWTWGLPHRYAAPTLPIISHDKGEEKPVAGQLLPEPLVANVGGEGAKEKGTPTTLATEIKPGPTKPADIGSDKNCKDVRGASDVMIVVRTSRVEVEKPPAHLVKLLACAHQFLIFSDHEGEIDGHTIHDALDIIPNTTRSKYEEFLEYDKMKADKKYKPSAEKAKALDKWKWLPMVYKVATMAPNHRFYMFIEPDTSLSWTNLLQWLDRLDYRIPYYSGVPDTIDDKRYAKSSPGIMLSYGTLQQYWPRYEELYATEWESIVAKECCGDLILATAMKQGHVEFYSSFGLLDPEAPSSLIWGQKFWCTPVVSWHGLTTTQADSLWDLQEAWTKKHGWATPYTHYNAFEQFVKPHLAEQKEDWDNVSSDTQLTAETGRREKLEKQKAEGKAGEQPARKEPPKAESKNTQSPNIPPFAKLPKREDALDTLYEYAADSAENCKATCQKTDDCLQWKYTSAGDGECHLGKALRLGAKVQKPDANAKWTSGWILDRVNRITEEWGRCERAEWKFNQ
ncbi:hypothetical protein SLS60_002403 [Paraconiothyrium brasiliense]|uniref:Glycosyltransferase family 31 protein n=1 Tax=Paraconiothyrium brasiliense TaxID=300254 RepID=A0ABR3S209_9PLEO